MICGEADQVTTLKLAVQYSTTVRPSKCIDLLLWSSLSYESTLSCSADSELSDFQSLCICAKSCIWQSECFESCVFNYQSISFLNNPFLICCHPSVPILTRLTGGTAVCGRFIATSFSIDLVVFTSIVLVRHHHTWGLGINLGVAIWGICPRDSQTMAL